MPDSIQELKVLIMGIINYPYRFENIFLYSEANRVTMRSEI